MALSAVIDLTIDDTEEAGAGTVWSEHGLRQVAGASALVTGRQQPARDSSTGSSRTGVNGNGAGHVRVLSSSGDSERPVKRRKTSGQLASPRASQAPRSPRSPLSKAANRWKDSNGWHRGVAKVSSPPEEIVDLTELDYPGKLGPVNEAVTAFDALLQDHRKLPALSSPVLASIEGHAPGISSGYQGDGLLAPPPALPHTLPSPETEPRRTQEPAQDAAPDTQMGEAPVAREFKAQRLAEVAPNPPQPQQRKLFSPRPYLLAADRRFLMDNPKYLPQLYAQLPTPTLHVSFTDREIEYLQYAARLLHGGNDSSLSRSVHDDLRHLLKKARKQSGHKQGGWDRLFDAHSRGYQDLARKPPRILLRRSREALDNFFADLYGKNNEIGQRIMRLQRQNQQKKPTSSSIVRKNNAATSHLLFMRETGGMRTFGRPGRYDNFRSKVKTQREDTFEPQIEWVDAAGDIFTISWVSNEDFVCGTTTHSDSRNQQYNKPGNLLLGSSRGSLRSFPDHRIPRPVVSEGENALDSMVESQDPWLYTSVVCSDYDAERKLAFTSSFDHTVKVWRVDEGSMAAVATWQHDGRVNFVLASKHELGMIATAADVMSGAVRVYRIKDSVTLEAEYDSYSCNKVHEEDYVPSDKWAYFPATLRWGLAPAVRHFLLIGYSPRSILVNDEAIPEDRLKTGELCVWDTLAKRQIKVISGSTQNVFEVAWHPYRNCFAASTSKVIDLDRPTRDHVKTQIRIFEPNSDGHYGAVKTLDCPAIDINELTIRPNSSIYFYVAASCTDGKVYIWDTALKDTDEPLRVLKHDKPIEPLFNEDRREEEDVGVKFTAWATTTERLYTGSSDGVVKVWDIRRGDGSPLVRDLLKADGPITFGAFSPDFTKLVVGDGAGKVYLAALNEEDDDDDDDDDETGNVARCTKPLPSYATFQIGSHQRRIRRPRPIIPHREPTPPTGEESGQQRARDYLQRQELVLSGDCRVGAVQGPAYASTGLFRAEAHLNDDPAQPLLSMFERLQLENNLHTRRNKVRRLRDIAGDEDDTVDDDAATDETDMFSAHQKNCETDLAASDLDVETLSAFKAERVEWDPEVDYNLDYEDDDDDND